MPRRSTMILENVGGALRAAICPRDEAFRVAAGTAPPTVIK